MLIRDSNAWLTLHIRGSAPCKSIAAPPIFGLCVSESSQSLHRSEQTTCASEDRPLHYNGSILALNSCGVVQMRKYQGRLIDAYVNSQGDLINEQEFTGQSS